MSLRIFFKNKPVADVDYTLAVDEDRYYLRLRDQVNANDGIDTIKVYYQDGFLCLMYFKGQKMLYEDRWAASSIARMRIFHNEKAAKNKGRQL